MAGVFMRDRRGKFGQRQRIEKPRNSWKLGEARKGCPLEPWRESVAPWFPTSGLQNWERTCFCYGKSLRLWCQYSSIWLCLLNSSSSNYLHLPTSLSAPSLVPCHLKDKVQVPYVTWEMGKLAGPASQPLCRCTCLCFMSW